jgi:UDP-N-acetylmuramoylalanine--D-glutamate ligase
MMMMMMDVQGKKALVVGVARSGVAAARLLASLGAMVIANDIRPEAQLAREAEQLRSLGVMLSLGGHPDSLFENAELIVLSPGVPSDLAQLDIAREKGVEIISEPELAGRFLRGRMIGVTGSNGKTTTTTLIGELMRAAGADVIVGGNIGTPLTSLIEKSSDKTWTVAELSSFQLEMIESLRVNVAVLTNITPDHLDRHGTFENYVFAKYRIFMNQTADDWAALNGWDETIAEMTRSLGVVSRIVYFSSRGRETLSGATADLYIREGRICTTMITEDRSELDVIAIEEIPLRGMHNVENVMAALASVFCALRTRPHEIAALTDAIKRFKGVEHRIEYVAEIEGVKFYNDSKATNVDSTAKALEAFDRNVIVILGGKDKGGDFAALAPLVEQRVKRIVLIGAAADKIAAQLEGLCPMTRAGSMQEATLRSMEAAVAGDTVLLAPACASFDMFDNYEHRGRVFKEEVFKLAHRIRSGWTGRLTT